MTWTKLSDDYSDDLYALSDGAFRLHTEGLVWSNRKLLDCVITPQDLQRLSNPDKVTELVELGVWEETTLGWIIIHHSIYQRSREQVMNQQRKNQMNGAKGGRPKGGRESWKEKPRKAKTKPLSDSQSKPLSNSQSKSKTESLSETVLKTENKTESLTERDGSGYKGKENKIQTDFTTWDVTPIPTTQAPDQLCKMCRINHHRQTPAMNGTAYCAEHLQELGTAAARIDYSNAA